MVPLPPLQLTLDADSLALALHAAVRLPLRPAMQAKATSAMGAALVPRAGELSDTGLGRAAWAAARLRRAPEGLWAALEGRLLELRQEGVAHPHALANLMWAFVAAQRCSPAILDVLTAAAWRMADELSLAEVRQLPLPPPLFWASQTCPSRQPPASLHYPSPPLVLSCRNGETCLHCASYYLPGCDGVSIPSNTEKMIGNQCDRGGIYSPFRIARSANYVVH